jgi:hypothetical protein
MRSPARRGATPASSQPSAAFDTLPAYFAAHLAPALGSLLLDAAVAAEEIRAGVDPVDLLHAVANLSIQAPGDGGGEPQPMVGLLIDGLRYGAKT